ncbi:MAG: ABC transporter ATP-binding protein [Deltaproteobacteria bacterium]|jgi:branched-chain amino acid transport system ATP-binding protein|nr:ABC transporter ATP-binding protein [Deltaproteobacteria bacterium]
MPEAARYREAEAHRALEGDLVLETAELGMVFGGLVALDNVRLGVERGSITALIGPNGAGKTTFFNCLTGIYPPTRGKIVLRQEGGKEIQLKGLTPDRVTQLGLARTFQNIRLFNNLTVLENVLIGCHSRMKAGLLGALLRDKKTMAEEKAFIDYSYSLLVRYGLKSMVNELAKNLPYGQQRRLEIVRALATAPKVLLLDEPAAGLNIVETRELSDLIRTIRDDEKLSVLLIEHDMSLVMNVSQTIYVMDYGRLIARGDPASIRKDPAVIKAYLGEE